MGKYFFIIFFLVISLSISGARAQDTEIPVSQMNAEQLYQEGVNRFSQSEYDRAIELLTNAAAYLSDKGNRIKAYEYLAVSHMAYSQIPEAQKAFREMLKLDACTDLDREDTPPKILEVFDLVKKNFKCEKFGSLSISSYAADSNDDIADADIYLDGKPLGKTPLTIASLKTGEYKLDVTKENFKPYTKTVSIAEGSNTLRMALETLIPRKQLLFDEAANLFDKEKFEDALERLSAAILEDPGFIEAYILRARAYNQIKGKHLMAVKDLQKAVQLAPDNIDARNLLAFIYIQMSEYDNAKLQVKKVTEQDAENSRAHELLGIIHYKNLECADAVKEFRKSLKNTPDNARLYHALGESYKNMGRLADAVIEYETAANLSPAETEFHISLAATYETANLNEAAVREWKTILNISKNKLEIDLAKQHLSNLAR